MRTRVKFCGITNEEDLAAAVAAGADAVGFNLFEGSSRAIDVDRCASLLAQVPALVTTVGIVVNPDVAFIDEIRRRLPFDLLQFHGDESEAFCVAYGRPYIKAIRVATAADLEERAYNFETSRALLLDARVDGAWGGTGVTFDWTLVRNLPKPVLLAGGLSADNVGEAIRVARPWAVDVSGGIEQSSRQKDVSKMNAFMAAVAAADHSVYGDES